MLSNAIVSSILSMDIDGKERVKPMIPDRSMQIIWTELSEIIEAILHSGGKRINLIAGNYADDVKIQIKNVIAPRIGKCVLFNLYYLQFAIDTVVAVTNNGGHYFSLYANKYWRDACDVDNNEELVEWWKYYQYNIQDTKCIIESIDTNSIRIASLAVVFSILHEYVHDCKDLLDPINQMINSDTFKESYKETLLSDRDITELACDYAALDLILTTTNIGIDMMSSQEQMLSILIAHNLPALFIELNKYAPHRAQAMNFQILEREEQMFISLNNRTKPLVIMSKISQNTHMDGFSMLDCLGGIKAYCEIAKRFWSNLMKEISEQAYKIEKYNHAADHEKPKYETRIVEGDYNWIFSNV